MEKYIYNDTLIEMMKAQRLFPVLRGKDKIRMASMARALAKAGIEIVEINIDAPEIFEAIEEVAGEITVCAGGIITSHQAEVALQAGAKVFSSPIFQTNLLKISKSRKIPSIAGTTTANEAYSAWKSRIPLIKLYPITAMGGTMYLEDILRPMPFLNIMPAGNIKLSEVKEYIKAGATSVAVGRDIYDGYTPQEITMRVQNFLKEVKS